MPSSDTCSEAERTDSGARLCNGCGTPLTGKRPQAQYCTDRCRSQARRNRGRRRVAAALQALAQAVADLRDELGGVGGDEPRPSKPEGR